MSPTAPTTDPERTEPIIFRADEGIVEFSLLLPAWQAAAIEEAAFARGLTAAQMLRGLIHDFFGRFVQPTP